MTRVWGFTTFAEVLGHYNNLRTDSHFDPTFNQLVDFTKVTNVEVSAEEIKQFAQLPLFGPGSRRALVSPGGAIDGLLRLFSAYRELSPAAEQMKVFGTMDEALNWLNDKAFS